MREVAAQSEQQRQQSTAVDAVDSVVTGPPLSVPSGSGKSTAEPKVTDNKAHRSPAASLPLASSKPANLVDAPVPEVRAEPQAVEESKGIGDAPPRENGVCRFFLTGRCIAARCRHAHELPKSTLSKASPSLKLPEPVEPSPLSYLPFSDVADLGIEATTSSAQRADNGLPSEAPPKPEPQQDSQPVRRWLPDPRPARWYDDICWRYREGFCPQGDLCHRTHTLAMDDRRAKKLWVVCRLYLIGACDYGDRCRRTHISPDSPTLTLPKQQSDSAPQRVGNVEPVDGNALPLEQCDSQTDVPVATYPSDAERTRPQPRPADKSREDESAISNEAEEKTITVEQDRDQSPYADPASSSNIVDNRPARRWSTICILSGNVNDD
ncbi:hypothetical protein C8Q72DRAFT_831057 [Fomitopsis betulina]|nr:hypothetical protein C8Q72DRAFT_831057 [Fomitopsis betulina]